MDDRVPEPLERQLHDARKARDPLADTGGLPVLSGLLFIDTFILIAGWGASASGRQILIAIVAFDVLILSGWLLAIPLRRWLYRPPS